MRRGCSRSQLAGYGYEMRELAGNKEARAQSAAIQLSTQLLLTGKQSGSGYAMAKPTWRPASATRRRPYSIQAGLWLDIEEMMRFKLACLDATGAHGSARVGPISILCVCVKS